MMRTTLVVGASKLSQSSKRDAQQHAACYTSEEDRMSNGIVQEVKIIEEPSRPRSPEVVRSDSHLLGSALTVGRIS